MQIKCELIEKVIYNLCLQAGQEYSKYPYDKILSAYKKKPSKRLAHILQNAENAHNIQRPLCQDTGTVHVFFEVGNEVNFDNNPIEAVNQGVKKCYIEQFFRKSIVENALISGKNLETNTPALVDIDYITGKDVKIKILLKGAGCDNVSETSMLLPTTTEKELIEYISDRILEKGKNACPPLYVSVAIGTGAEKAMTEAEKNYFKEKSDLPEIRKKIIEKVQQNADKKYENFFLADLKITAKPHHMASLPVAIAFNCHSLRIAEAIITNNSVRYITQIPDFETITVNDNNVKEINVNNREELLELTEGENVLLSGEILIARDAAHKKMLEYKNEGKHLPFEPNNSVIFYAAPCPPKLNEIVGPIGPTTANRMDKFLDEFPNVIATLGKGERSDNAKKIIKKNRSVYFEIEGGIATLLSSCFENYKTIAFQELSTESVCLAKIKNLPAKVSVSAK